MAELNTTKLETTPVGVAGAVAVISDNFEKIEKWFDPSQNAETDEYGMLVSGITKNATIVNGSIARFEDGKLVGFPVGAQDGFLKVEGGDLVVGNASAASAERAIIDIDVDRSCIARSADSPEVLFYDELPSAALAIGHRVSVRIAGSVENTSGVIYVHIYDPGTSTTYAVATFTPTSNNPFVVTFDLYRDPDDNKIVSTGYMISTTVSVIPPDKTSGAVGSSVYLNVELDSSSDTEAVIVDDFSINYVS